MSCVHYKPHDSIPLRTQHRAQHQTEHSPSYSCLPLVFGHEPKSRFLLHPFFQGHSLDGGCAGISKSLFLEVFLLHRFLYKKMCTSHAYTARHNLGSGRDSCNQHLTEEIGYCFLLLVGCRLQPSRDPFRLQCHPQE